MTCHIHVTEKTTRETFKSLLKKHAFPPNSEYTDYYGAINILHDILDFFGTKSIVDSVKLSCSNLFIRYTFRPSSVENHDF